MSALRNASVRDANGSAASSTVLRPSSSGSDSGIAGDASASVLPVGHNSFSYYRRFDGELGSESIIPRQSSNRADSVVYGDVHGLNGRATTSVYNITGSGSAVSGARGIQPELTPGKAVHGVASEQRRVNSHDR